jgi:hypothetical protein
VVGLSHRCPKVDTVCHSVAVGIILYIPENLKGFLFSVFDGRNSLFFRLEHEIVPGCKRGFFHG